MSEKEKNKRREFLNHVCPAVAMAFLGVPAIQSCSSGDDDTDMGSGNNNGGNTGGNTDWRGNSRDYDSFDAKEDIITILRLSLIHI